MNSMYRILPNRLHVAEVLGLGVKKECDMQAMIRTFGSFLAIRTVLNQVDQLLAFRIRKVIAE
jgi:hypothetical protein